MHGIESDIEFLVRNQAGHAGHTGASLLDHLRGTAALLEGWGLPDHVVRAGLFHSVYGTEAFDDAVVAVVRRHEVSAQIGEQAEALVNLFCTVDRSSLYACATLPHDGEARCRLTGASIPLSPSQVRDLLHIAAANWLEQRERLDPARQRKRSSDHLRLARRLEPAARQMVEAAVAELGAHSPAERLSELFAFADSATVDQHCAKLDIDYMGAISHRINRQADRSTLDRLARLSDDAFVALLRSPNTCYRIFGTGRDFATYVDDSLAVEEWRAGVRPALERSAWSATGDLHVPAGASAGPSAIASDSASAFSPDRVYRAPLLGWITVDLYSPGALRTLEALPYKTKPFGPAEPLSDGERLAVVDKLTGALAGIERTNPSTARFLRYSLNTIIPRKQTNPDLYPSNSFKGSSTAATLHRANIYNIQNANVDTANLAQSIIHESVHNHLYKRELFQPTLLDEAAGERLRLESPWSGNTLDLYVFVHSSAVWFALHQFFSNRAASLHLPGETVEAYRRRAISGFSRPEWAQIAHAHSDLIAPGVLRDLWAMREIVTSRGTP